MSDYSFHGIYIKEFVPVIRLLAGVYSSIGFIGETERSPSMNLEINDI